MPPYARILLAIDGEPHTAAAVAWALELAGHHDAELVAVHVRDPYLKQFHNELYAQGRLEYLDHVDECLQELADEATAAFAREADHRAVRWEVKVLDGEPIRALTLEAESGDYGLVVIGRRPLSGLRAWRSRDLPGKLVAALRTVPVLVVPGAD